jgi:CpeS-like protein
MKHMLSFQDFFDACAGLWKTERIYHYMLDSEIERSYTEFQASVLTQAEKQKMLTPFFTDAAVASTDALADPDFKLSQIEPATLELSSLECPGFAISFETRSETGDEVSMSLKALFVPDRYMPNPPKSFPPMPLVAQMGDDPDVTCGFYLRDEGYSEAGAIAGRFTYQPTRQTLEMTTYYRRSIAVDQMRLVTPDTRLRTIVTYDRPTTNEPPTVINLVGFGVEKKQAA